MLDESELVMLDLGLCRPWQRGLIQSKPFRTVTLGISKTWSRCLPLHQILFSLALVTLCLGPRVLMTSYGVGLAIPSPLAWG